jgi:putative nucleotidyltransferase with HDIG domain
VARILIVDDEPDVCGNLKEYFMTKGYDVYTAGDGYSAIRQVKEVRPNVVLLDVFMPGMSGIEVLKEIKKIDSTAGVIMVSAMNDRESIERAMVLGTDDFITKPFDLQYIDTAVAAKISDLLSRAEEKLRNSYEKLQTIFDGVVKAIARIVETRDPYTSGHQERVSMLAVAMADEMGLSPDHVDAIRTAATIHDLGKIYVPAEILTRPSNLKDIEFNLIKTHPAVGCDILKSIDFTYPISEIIHQHHERINGSGYPRGLVGESMLLEAKIIAVADTIEAMASHRPYRPAVGIEKGLEEIFRNRGILYDPVAVDVCLRLFKENNFSFESGSESILLPLKQETLYSGSSPE